MSAYEVQGLEIVVHVEVPLTSLPGPSRHALAARANERLVVRMSDVA